MWSRSSPEAHYLLKKHLNWDGPVVITLHEGPKKRFARKHTGALRETLSEATVIQVLCPSMPDNFAITSPPKRVVVDSQRQPQFEFASELTVPQVICVGRIYPSKRQDLLIEAFAELRGFSAMAAEALGRSAGGGILCPKGAGDDRDLRSSRQSDFDGRRRSGRKEGC